MLVDDKFYKKKKNISGKNFCKQSNKIIKFNEISVSFSYIIFVVNI